jgi:hypothetical protein
MNAGRELDALIAARVFGLFPIEWRICEYSPDGCGLEEVEYFGDREKGERHPCYNWLDTDAPRANGWTEEDIATTERAARWKPVAFYSTEMGPAWDAGMKVGMFSRGFKWRGIETLGVVLQHNPKSDTWAVVVRYYDGDADLAADNCTSPEQAICLAALKAVEAK